MDTSHTTDVPCLKTDLKNIRELSGDKLKLRYYEIPSIQRLGHKFFENLDTSKREAAMKCCLLLYGHQCLYIFLSGLVQACTSLES